nr:IS5 family transposase [Paracoccus caeni]
MVIGLPPVPSLEIGGAVGGHSGRAELCGDRARHATDARQHRNTRPLSCGGRKWGPQKETLGRSRGGFTTKIHLRVNGAGLPMSTVITPEQDSDYIGYDLVMADNLLQPAVLVADRGYDTDKIREDIENRNALPFVGKTVLRTVFRPFSLPMRKNRKVRKVIYTLRNMVERCFNKLKNSRRLATGYNETTDSFLCFIDIACIRLGRRHLSK